MSSGGEAGKAQRKHPSSMPLDCELTRWCATVKFGEIDGTVNARLCDRLEILGYPSLLLFPAGPKMEGNCHTFHGERTLGAQKAARSVAPTPLTRQIARSEHHGVHRPLSQHRLRTNGHGGA